VKAHGRSQGWIVGCLRREEGAGDQLWHKVGHRGRLVEVKASKAGPFADFPPADRQALKERAETQSLDPLLAYAPSPSKPIQWFSVDQWPRVRSKT
jgi:hypothetical protein